MKRRLAPSILTVPLILAACGTDTETAGTPGGEATETTQTTDPDSPGYTNVLGSTGETVTAGGITITVDDVTETRSIEVMESPSPMAETTTETAPAGQTYIEVETTVENDSSHPWDLTCSQPIAATLADGEGNIFLPMRDAYEVPGNPECNSMLNPGLSANMTWRFEMSEDSTPKYFGFAEPEVNYETPYFIEIA